MREVSRFVIGDVLQKSLSIYVRNLPAVIVLAGVLVLAGAVVWAVAKAVPMEQLSEDDLLVLWLNVGKLYASVFLGICWFEGGVTFVVVRALRAGPPTWREVLAHTVRAVPHTIGAAATVGLGTVAPVVLAVLGLEFVGFVSKGDIGMWFLLFGLVGFVKLALLVPITILTLVWWVAVPVASVERGGVRRALKRSHELTRGHKGRIFRVRLLINFCIGAACLVVVPIGWWVAGVVAAVGLTVQSAVVVVCYHDLRVLKEGGGSGRIAEVFA